MESRLKGYIWLVSLIVFWAYYTFWIMVSPFIDTTHVIQSYFPDRKWGIVIPILLGIGFLSVALTFIGIALIMDSKVSEQVNKKIEERNKEEKLTLKSQLSLYKMQRFNP